MWFDVAYKPGELKAVAYKDGKVIGETAVKTAGEPYSIKLTPDRNTIEASGDDLSYILMEAYDKNGNLCPLADNMINIEIKGPGEIAGVANGNPQSLDPFVSNYGKLFYGKAMLIVRSKEFEAGKIDIEATSKGLKPGKISVTTK
jgi:beta-galactosidase